MATRVVARDPAYICSSDLFRASSNSSERKTQQQIVAAQQYEGAVRKVAHRGSEVFVVVGNELRWSDVNVLKDAEDGRHSAGERVYRTLKTPVALPITQLSVSPSGDYLAILTSHTVHVCILPSPSQLHVQDASPLRLKSFHLGPTTHVLETSPLVSALWHPLAPSGDCLVTLTHDTCVRLWELDPTSRSSFSEPALAVDLKKLANATSTHADFSTSKYGANRGFSPDDVEMQVAAACFGGQGNEDEHGWAGMTLWIAMTEGDVYALCPLIPSKWSAPTRVLGSLSTSVLQKEAAQRRDADASESERRIVEQQRRWLAELDGQDPLLLPGRNEFETVEVYTRPAGLSAVPKLQGPFAIAPEPEFGEITDIHIVAPKIDSDALDDEAEEEEEDEEGGLSVGLVCLATTTNEIHVCLCPDLIEAEWLPGKRSRSTYALDDVEDVKDLLLFETIDLAQPGSASEDNGYPTFTHSPTDRYAVLVTHPTGVTSLDFTAWITTLEDELASPQTSGTAFRLDLLLDSTPTSISQPLTFTTQSATSISTAIAIPDDFTNTVTLLTTTAPDTPYATLLAQPSNPFAPEEPLALPAPEPRAPYRPPPALTTAPKDLANIISRAAAARGPDALKAPIRFSPATLALFTEAHRVLANETHALGLAAAELFRVCERVREELQAQVQKVHAVQRRVDDVIGGGGDDDDSDDDGSEGEGVETSPEIVERRLQAAKEKGEQLRARCERLRGKMGRLGGAGALSAKEKAFAAEVERAEGSVMGSHALLGDSAAASPGDSSTLAGRVEALEKLQRDLVRRAEEVSASTVAGAGKEVVKKTDGTGGSAVGGGYRRQKLEVVMGLLERESALVEGVMERLRRLQQA